MSNNPIPSRPSDLQDLLGTLIWPKLLWAPHLALRPTRALMATFALVAVALADRIPALWNPDGAGSLRAWAAKVPEFLSRLRWGIMTGHADSVGEALRDIAIRTPRGLAAAAPVSAFATLAIALPVWALLCAAICRSCAAEAAISQRLAWTQALGFGLSRWRSAVGVLLTPWVLFYAALALLAGLGWLMLNFVGAQVAGGLFFFVALILGLLGMLALLGLMLGGCMLVPAVACEGTDWIDSLQRVYAYTVSRPLRLASYLAVLVVQGIICIGLAFIFARLVSLFSLGAATLLVHEPLASELRGEFPTQPFEVGWSHDAAVALVRFWSNIPTLLAAGYAVSYVCSAGTLLYLAMRRLCDGQDIGELWQPGMVEGTYSPDRASGDDED